MGFQFPSRPLRPLWGWGGDGEPLPLLSSPGLPRIPPSRESKECHPPSSFLLSPPFPPHLGGRGGDVAGSGQVSGGGKRRSGHWGHWTEERVTGQSKGSQITTPGSSQAKSAWNEIPRMLGGGWGRRVLPLFSGWKLLWDTGRDGWGCHWPC